MLQLSNGTPPTYSPHTDAALLCHCTNCQGNLTCITDGACFFKVMIAEYLVLPFPSSFCLLPPYLAFALFPPLPPSIPPSSPSPPLPPLSPLPLFPSLPSLTPLDTHMPSISLLSSQSVEVESSTLTELGCLSKHLLTMCDSTPISFCCNTSLCNNQTHDATTVQIERSSDCEWLVLQVRETLLNLTQALLTRQCSLIVKMHFPR